MTLFQVVTNRENHARKCDGATPVETNVALCEKIMEICRDHCIEEGEFIRVVVVKRSPVDGSGFSDVRNHILGNKEPIDQRSWGWSLLLNVFNFWFVRSST